MRANPLIILARPKGFEPLTPRFVVWCSIQLSYGRMPDIAGPFGRPAKPHSWLLGAPRSSVSRPPGAVWALL